MNHRGKSPTSGTTSEPTGMSIAALVTGIFSVVLFWVPGVHFILGTLAIIFGAITLKKARFGKAGLVLGIVSWVLVITYWVIVMGFMMSSAVTTTAL